MTKESIIRKLKENKKLILVFSIIFISGIIVGISILNIKTPKSEPKLYIATDDISMVWNSPEFHAEFNGSQTFIVSGEYASDIYSRFYGAWIQFDLTDRPDNWESVEISLYNFEYDGEYNFRGIDLDLWAYKQDWNDTMTHAEVKSIIQFGDYWRDDIPNTDKLTIDLGLQRINITNQIKDYFDNGHNGFVSLRLSGMVGASGYVKVYSKEWIGNKSCLPQLIWS